MIKSPVLKYLLYRLVTKFKPFGQRLHLTFEAAGKIDLAVVGNQHALHIFQFFQDG